MGKFLLKRRAGIRSALWLIAAYGLLLFALSSWRGWKRPMFWPRSPFDAINSATARDWLLLNNLREWVPPGASFTVIADPLSREMPLFMMSYGLLPRGIPIPSSYFERPIRSAGARARYVLAFPCQAADGDWLRVIATTGGGCVLTRARSMP